MRYCLFFAILASMRSGAKQAALMYQQVNKNFGLTVSFPRQNIWSLEVYSERESIAFEGGDIESVDEFPYHGLVVASLGRMDVNVDK